MTRPLPTTPAPPHARTAVHHCSSTPSVPRGAAAHGAAHKAGRRPFIFCAARGPDVHVPKSCRFGRADWLLLHTCPCAPVFYIACA
eukprot:scaffold2708_cov100-Isochrysis_galbana.AAC.3